MYSSFKDLTRSVSTNW